MKERNALTVSRVEGLLLVAVFQQLKPPVREHAIAIHQDQPDASGATINFGDLEV
jgi:hypothetical protein